MIGVYYSGYGYSIESYDPDNEDLCIYGKVKPYVGKFLISLNGFAEIIYFSSATVSFLFGDDSIIIICDESGNEKPIELFATGEMSTSHGNKIKIDINDLKSETTPPIDAPAEKPLNPKEKNTTLNIIYGLLEISKKDTGKSQAEIINELENYGYRGLKKSTLEKYFSEANKIHQRG